MLGFPEKENLIFINPGSPSVFPKLKANPFGRKKNYKKSLTKSWRYAIRILNKEISMFYQQKSQTVVLSQIILLGIIEGIIISPSPPGA
jgi:hypothetical protein